MINHKLTVRNSQTTSRHDRLIYKSLAGWKTNDCIFGETEMCLKGVTVASPHAASIQQLTWADKQIVLPHINTKSSSTTHQRIKKTLVTSHRQ